MHTHEVLHRDLGPTQLHPQQNCFMFLCLNCLSLRNLLPKKFHSINKQLISLIADFITYLLKYNLQMSKILPSFC